MQPDDPVRNLAHDHADLTRRVLALGDSLTRPRALLPELEDLREHMFLHFAREEEGLFPLVSEHFPELAEQVLAMGSAHDAICGALARMIHTARAEVDATSLHVLLARFQAAYADHARNEAELLHRLDAGLDAAQRAKLAELVRGL